VGQPEFEELLNSERLKQLKQRLAVHATILPLTPAESMEYVMFRLWKAGSNPASVFTERALKAIIKKAKGIPRVLNILCDNALITAFGYQEKPVTERVVREIIRDFEGARRPRRVLKWLPAAAVAAVLLFLLPAGWSVLPERHAPDWTVATPPSSGQTEQIAPAEVAPQVDERSSEKYRSEPAAAKEEPKSPLSRRDESAAVVKTVAPGDTLLRLARDVYGPSTGAPDLNKLLDLVKINNPQIRNANVILPGQRITFPDSGKTRGDRS